MWCCYWAVLFYCAFVCMCVVLCNFSCTCNFKFSSFYIWLPSGAINETLIYDVMLNGCLHHGIMPWTEKEFIIIFWYKSIKVKKSNCYSYALPGRYFTGGIIYPSPITKGGRVLFLGVTDVGPSVVLCLSVRGSVRQNGPMHFKLTAQSW